MSFPSIEVPTTISVTYKKDHLISSHPKFIFSPGDKIGLRMFNLHWENMGQSDLDALSAAIESDMGGSFIWDNFYNKTKHKVIYAKNGFEYSMTEDYVPGHYSVDLQLQEVKFLSFVTTTTTTT